MQAEAIERSVTRLQEHARANGSGRARGRIILPCGTGKSRIALRIVERLTEPGQVSAVLCPSIALVSQLRAEFLAHCTVGMNALAVCSDEGVARDKDLASDPTADLGHASVSEIKGRVTTQAAEIGEWMGAVAAEGDRIGVIFGIYQSSHRIAEALGDGRQIRVMVADEAHRTAGLRRVAKLTERLRDFTFCHDDARFPAKYRIYQTATPRIYTGGPKKNEDWIVRGMADESVFGPELYRQSYAAAERGAKASRAGGVRIRKRTAPPPERGRGPSGRWRLRGAALHRDAELPRLVDEVLGDAGAGEGDDALRREVEQFVVAAEGCGASMAVPVGLADDLGGRRCALPSWWRSSRRRDRRRGRAPCRHTWRGPCRGAQ